MTWETLRSPARPWPPAAGCQFSKTRPSGASGPSRASGDPAVPFGKNPRPKDTRVPYRVQKMKRCNVEQRFDNFKFGGGIGYQPYSTSRMCKMLFQPAQGLHCKALLSILFLSLFHFARRAMLFLQPPHKVLTVQCRFERLTPPLDHDHPQLGSGGTPSYHLLSSISRWDFP